MAHLLDLAVAVFDSKRQWYSGEVVQVKSENSITHYLKNDGGVIHLCIHYKHSSGDLMKNWSSEGLTIALLNPYKGCWELTPAILDQWEPWRNLCVNGFVKHMKRIAPLSRPGAVIPVIKYMGQDQLKAASSGKEAAYKGCKNWEARKAVNLAAAA